MLTRAALYTRGLGSRSVRALSTHSGFAGQGQGVALQQQQQQHHQHSRSQWQATAAAFAAAAAAAAATTAVATATLASCDDGNSDAVYTRAQVSAHKGGASGTWVTYKDGVYDVTQFVEDHPGGKERIMMAAGGRVDPFWSLYRQHMTDDVQTILKGLRIGTLHPDDVAKDKQRAVLDPEDPYSNEPERHPALIVRKEQPFNAETPVSLIADHYITPPELWYRRHHHPVPHVDASKFRLQIDVKASAKAGTAIPRTSMDLKSLQEWFAKTKVVATMQCAGNRRSDYLALEPVQGLPWATGAISTAEWQGATLVDVLASMGIPDIETARAMGIKHIQFLAEDAPYDASLPIEMALDPRRQILLAYEMNGEPINADCGGPVRVIVPGVVGARNVKWVKSIVASSEPSPSTWQSGIAYKSVTSSVKSYAGIDPTKLHSVYELPVQSAICNPAPGSTVEIDPLQPVVDVSGYAVAGGGRGIVRVEVSTDGGETWHEASLGEGKEQPFGQAWAWTMWEAEVPLSPALRSNRVELMCRAIDTSMNTQPGEIKPLWNRRGILNNSWHRVKIEVDGE